MATGPRPTSMAPYRRAVVKLSAFLYLAASLVATVVILLPPVRAQSHFGIALALTALGVFAAFTVNAFPWHRFHPNWFITIGIIASVHVAVFMWSTGGSASPFWPFVVFIVLSSTAYYSDRWPVLLLTCLSIWALASPLLYERPISAAFLAELIVQLTVVAISFAIGRWLFRGLERNVMAAVRLEEERQLVDQRRQFVSVVTHEF